MKVRIKFTKHGAMRFVGHLDMLRYFQKAARRAGLDAAYSAGFSPHMIMSFASPLSVGMESDAEYFDMELVSAVSAEDLRTHLNKAMADGVTVTSVVRIPEEKSSNAMALVAACDYRIRFKDPSICPSDIKERIAAYLSQTSIYCMKKSKRGETRADIRPWIYALYMEEPDVLFLRAAGGSSANLKPELLLTSLFEFAGADLVPYSYIICRGEIYADTGEEGSRVLMPLSDLGTDF